MNAQVSVPTTVLDKLERLANLLEDASILVREIGLERPIAFRVPDLKRPAHVPGDEAWFWSPEWQAGEREANEELARGGSRVFANVADALVELHSHV